MFRILISVSVKFFSWILAFYACYMFLRGHNAPGGGFIGGLLLSLSGILYHKYTNSKSWLSKISIFFPHIMGALMFLLILTTTLPLWSHQPFFKGLWTSISLPIAGKLSSVLVFDAAIFLIVAFGVFHSYLMVIRTQIDEDKHV